MYKNRFILLFLVLVASACEIVTYKEFALPEYDGALNWQQIVKNAEWENRYDHEAIAFNNKLWVIGGYNPGQVKGDTYYEDVWSSDDGKSWKLVIDDAPWLGRRGHELVVFNDGAGDAIYLIGGFSVDEANGYRQYNNDVWKTTDGENWTLIKKRTYPELSSVQDWFPRMHHSCVVATHGGINYIYLIAGKTMLENHESRYATEYFNDVWRSTDGINWELLVSNDFGIRAELAATVGVNNQLYINGGVHGIIFEAEGNATHPITNWQALWTSSDGENWSDLRDSTIVEDRYLYRSAHQMVFYKDLVWSLPGKTISNEHYMFASDSYYPSWTYDSNGYWGLDSKGVAIDARHSYDAFVWKDKIWIFGGFTATYGQSNDVWTATL
ncbi:MAG: hypothetical protein KAI79_12565 [Bacteroidales bacterium]|nr:hypothetical protein [Bacteroidales bacterium]